MKSWDGNGRIGQRQGAQRIGSHGSGDGKERIGRGHCAAEGRKEWIPDQVRNDESEIRQQTKQESLSPAALEPADTERISASCFFIAVLPAAP